MMRLFAKSQLSVVRCQLFMPGHAFTSNGPAISDHFFSATLDLRHRAHFLCVTGPSSFVCGWLWVEGCSWNARILLQPTTHNPPLTRKTTIDKSGQAVDL